MHDIIKCCRGIPLETYLEFKSLVAQAPDLVQSAESTDAKPAQLPLLLLTERAMKQTTRVDVCLPFPYTCGATRHDPGGLESHHIAQQR